MKPVYAQSEWPIGASLPKRRGWKRREEKRRRIRYSCFGLGAAIAVSAGFAFREPLLGSGRELVNGALAAAREAAIGRKAGRQLGEDFAGERQLILSCSLGELRSLLSSKRINFEDNRKEAEWLLNGGK